MAKEENSDKKKKKSDEVADYESLLDDFTSIFNESEEESGDSKVDHDGLALSELLGEDVTMTPEPTDTKESQSGSDDELSEFTQELEGLGLDEFEESEDTVESADKEEITIEDNTEESPTIKHGIDALADIYGNGSEVEEETSAGDDSEDETVSVDDSAVTQEIQALGFDDLAGKDADETQAEEEPIVDDTVNTGELESVEDTADTGELGSLDLGELPDFDLTEEEPVKEIEEEAVETESSGVTQEIEALGFDDLADTVTIDETQDETQPEEDVITAESIDTGESEIPDYESLADMDVSSEDDQEEEFSIDTGMDEPSLDTITEESGDDTSTEMILDEEVKVSDTDYASILDELDSKKPETEETFDVSDVEEISDVSDVSGLEDLEILEDDDTGELSFTDLEESAEVSSEEDSSEDSVFMDLDLDLDDEAEDFVAEEEPAVSVAPPDSGEDDFLGLSGISSDSGGSAGAGSATEVLFDGVEMNFDEQISLVTHAEILLAQKKTEEAAELLKRVAERKGETHWVAKRLRTFGGHIQKPDTAE